MTVQELFDYILTQMSAEDALMKLLVSSVDQYNLLKLGEGVGGHPMGIMFAASQELGWNVAINESEDGIMHGIAFGDEVYFEKMFGEPLDECDDPNHIHDVKWEEGNG